ncbi:hypothetical protein QUA44_22050, partial [Microcoleus sp. N9_A2]|uniref:hypothetical protein n=1 Tax=unclassified Microcoleus TaxID=2642155 RepID=UPI002FD2E2F9
LKLVRLKITKMLVNWQRDAGLTPWERSSGTSVRGKTRRVLYRKCPTAKGIVYACRGGDAL